MKLVMDDVPVERELTETCIDKAWHMTMVSKAKDLCALLLSLCRCFLNEVLFEALL